MPSAATTTDRETPWFRFVRILVVLYVGILERKIARLLAELDTLEYLSPAYMALNERIYFIEDIRDAYLAWLEDPSNPLPRPYDPNVRRRARFRTPALGMRPHAPAPRAAILRYARCTIPLPFLPSPPGVPRRGGAPARP